MADRVELVRALATLAERPGPEHARIAELLGLAPSPTDDVWTQVFLFNLYPYASVHLGAEGKLGGEARDRVAGFFRALDAVPPNEPDDLTTLLVAWAQLAERSSAGDERADHAATTLLHEHLLTWLPQYTSRVAALAPEPYRSWARLLDGALREAAEGRVGPTLLPLHLRESPPFVDPREDDEASLTEQLLAPVRCGFVLTTTDLRRAGRETELPLRIGERRYVLDNLFGQSVPTTLRWLAEHAVAASATAWEPWADVVPEVAAWWQGRARTTSELLLALAEEAEHATVVPVV